METDATVLDGEYKIEIDLDNVDDTESLEAKVKKYKKTTVPFDKRKDIDFDTYYYGNVTDSGLIEVRKRTARDVSGNKWNDIVMWYEGNIMVDGEGRKIAYHVIHEPNVNELFPDYFYPTTQWNISRMLLSEQDNIPGWKRMVAMNVIVGQEPAPFRVMNLGIARSELSAFHFVIVNRSYVPIEVNGRKVDGRFVLSPPASGKYIKSYRDAIKVLGGSPIGLSRQRAADDAVPVIS